MKKILIFGFKPADTEHLLANELKYLAEKYQIVIMNDRNKAIKEIVLSEKDDPIRAVILTRDMLMQKREECKIVVEMIEFCCPAGKNSITVNLIRYIADTEAKSRALSSTLVEEHDWKAVEKVLSEKLR